MNREIKKEIETEAIITDLSQANVSTCCHTQTQTLLLIVLRQYLLMYITHCSRFFCTCLLTTLHYSNLADADQRSAASFSRAPNAGSRDGSRHPVHPRAARARGLLELLACHAGWATSRCWLHHVAGCHCNRQHPQWARTHTHTYIHT